MVLLHPIWLGKRSWAWLGNTGKKAPVGCWALRSSRDQGMLKWYFKVSSPAPRPTDKGVRDKMAVWAWRRALNFR